MRKKKIPLNVMLLKEGINISSPDAFINGYTVTSEIEFERGELKAILYKRVGGFNQPDWIENLKTKIIGQDFSDIFPSSQTSGATLFIQVRDRVFAINFGILGRFNIEKEAIDRNFGIYTANKILHNNENAKLKAANSRVNETNPVNKQRQYGAAITNNQLFLTMEDNEALRELVISNNQSEDFHRLIGKYSSLNVQFVFNENEIPCLQYLPAKLENLLDIYLSVTKDDIKQLFKGIFPLDDRESEALNAQLANKISSSSESFFLFEPEIDFDISSVSEFRIVTSDGTVASCDELALSAYLDLVSSPTREDLENDKIHVLDEDDRRIKSWSVFDCLYGEIEENDANYILSHGRWYEVTRDKYNLITSTVNNIIDNTFVVDDDVKNATRQEIEVVKQRNPRIMRENIFNSKLCEHIGGELFDRTNKQISVYEDKFEVCDILIPETLKFIHVKCNRGINELSHLFNQGFVSANSYAKFKNVFSSKVNAHITDAAKHIPVNPKNACVHYLIINDRTENRLTFFSKMALESKIRVLEAMGIEVKLSWVNGVY